MTRRRRDALSAKDTDAYRRAREGSAALLKRQIETGQVWGVAMAAWRARHEPWRFGGQNINHDKGDTQ